MTDALAMTAATAGTGYANEITAKCLQINQSVKLAATTRTSTSERLTGELVLGLDRKCVLRFEMRISYTFEAYYIIILAKSVWFYIA